MITVEKAQEYADLVLWMKKTTFGEEAREKIPGKQKGQDKEIFLKCLCALLNSGGGVLHINIENQNYNYMTDALGKDLEDSVKQLLDPNRIEDFLEIEQKNNTMYFFVKSWRSAKGNTRLFSLNSGLVERSGTSALSISPSLVINFLKRQQDQESTLELDAINNKAADFYNNEKAHFDQILDFGESDTVEFKSFSNEADEKKLVKELRKKIPTYLSAFGNTRGGFLFIGIDDKTKEVVGCGQGLSLGELQNKVQDICRTAGDQAIHMKNCERQIQWSPEIKVFAVTPEQKKNVTEPENPPFIVAVKIPPFCCAVFEKDPESWEIEGHTVSQIKCDDWLKKQQPFIPDDDLVKRFESALNLQEAPPRCKPVYSIEKITELQNRIFPVTGNSTTVPESICDELFNEYPEVQTTFTNLQQRPGILIVSQSWAVDISQSRNPAVLADALLITSGDYPRFYSIVENETPELWTYARETAFHLKQKLVNLGGYTGRICVIPHLVKCDTGELIQNEPGNAPLYPQSYKLDEKKKIKALLRSLVIVVLSFTSPLSDRLGSEFLNLLTEEQFNILHGYSGIKDLFVHGLPGTGKTVLAMEKIKQIRNMTGCHSWNILFLCENVGLKAFLKRRNLCTCETRSGFMNKNNQAFRTVKHVVVDEGQNFRDEDGDWYRKARELTRDGGVLWVFLDYFQKCHLFNDGLPPLSHQNIVPLHKVVRNSTKVFEVMQQQITTIAHDSQGDMSTHLQSMREKMTRDHIFEGNFRHIKLRQTTETSAVTNLLERLQEEGHSARDIAVLFSTQEDPTLITLQGAALCFRHGDVDCVDDDVVVMDTIRRFSGLERNIVIVVDPYTYQSMIRPKLLLSAFSRARIRLYRLDHRPVRF